MEIGTNNNHTNTSTTTSKRNTFTNMFFVNEDKTIVGSNKDQTRM